MRNQNDYINSFSKIKAIDLEDILRIDKWSLVSETYFSSPCFVYQKTVNEQTYQALVPQSSNFSDYANIMFLNCQAISRYKNQPIDDVLESFLFPHYDLIKFHKEGSFPSGLISVDEGSSLFESVRKTLICLSNDVIRPSPYREKMRVNKSEEDLLNKSFFGQTKVGSFIATVLIDLDSNSNDSDLVQGTFIGNSEGDQLSNSFGRKVVGKMCNAMAAVKGKIETKSDIEELVNPSLPSFISVNSIDAISGLADYGSKTSIDVSWSPIADKNRSSYDHLVFIPSEAAKMKTFVSDYKKVTNEEEITLNGLITSISGSPDISERDFCKICFVATGPNGIRSSYKAKLNKNDYPGAFERFENGMPISISGKPTPSGFVIGSRLVKK